MHDGGHRCAAADVVAGTRVKNICVASQRSSEATDETPRSSRPAIFFTAEWRKKFQLSIRPQEIHQPSTGFPQTTPERVRGGAEVV